MIVLRWIVGSLLGVSALGATLAGASILLAPIAIDGPVVAPINVPSWVEEGEKA